MKAKKWFAYFRGNVYANDFVFDVPVSRRIARLAIIEWLGVNRLPTGTQIWPDYDVDTRINTLK